MGIFWHHPLCYRLQKVYNHVDSPLKGYLNYKISIFAYMKTHFGIFTSILILVVASSCRHDTNLSPYGWEPLDAQSDSLILTLERSWYDGTPDSTLETYVARLRDMADIHPGDGLPGVRTDYWEGRLMMRQGNYDEGIRLYDQALAANDSAAHPYETHRLMWALEPDDMPYTPATYDYLLEQTRFFESRGDMMLAATTSMDLGMFLRDLRQAQQATVWLDRADSLFRLAGMEQIIISNKLNRCNVMATAGDTLGAVVLLQELVADPEFRQDPKALDLALNNLFVFGRDTAALFEAYNTCRYNPAMTDITAFYEGCLAGIYLGRSEIDSAAVYAERALAGFDLIDNRRLRVDVLAWASDVARARGDNSAANELMARRLEETELLMDEMMHSDVLSHEMSLHLAQLDYMADKRALRLRIILVSTISACILAFCVIFFMFYRRINRHRLRLAEEQLRNEKTNRRLMATELALEQQQVLIDDIERSIAGTDNTVGHKVDSAIRTYRAAAEKEETAFRETFSELHPSFVTRLLANYPSLTPADCRLLSMIAIGMSNKRIASTLGIRPESVKQSRWRLRRKMALDPDTTLEAAIAPLLN